MPGCQRDLRARRSVTIEAEGRNCRIWPMAAPKARLLGWGLGLGLLSSSAPPAAALPSPERVPEEVLRTEVTLEARSPLDNRPLTPAEYATLKAQLAQPPTPPLDPQLRQLIFLLNLRKFLRTITPL